MAKIKRIKLPDNETAYDIYDTEASHSQIIAEDANNDGNIVLKYVSATSVGQ